MSATRSRLSSPIAIEAARDAGEDGRRQLRPAALDRRLSVATEPGAALVWPGVPNNITFDWAIGDKAATDAEFAKATHVTRLTVVNNRIVVSVDGGTRLLLPISTPQRAAGR